MGKRDFNRPSFRVRGKSTESTTGSDMPSEFRTVPRSLPRPKAAQRLEAEKALREFMAKKPKPAHQQPLEKVNILPPWEDDDPTPF